MFLRLLFLLTFIPIAEIYFLLQLGQKIGGTNTFLIILSTGILGAWLMRKQGASILRQIQNSASQNQIPSDAIASGFFVFVGGLLLLTPGLITDVLGLSLVFPLTQKLWKKYFINKWQSGLQSGRIQVVSFGGSPWGRQKRYDNEGKTAHQMDGRVIDISAKKSQTIEKEEQD